MAFFVVSHFRDFVIDDLCLFRFIRLRLCNVMLPNAITSDYWIFNFGLSASGGFSRVGLKGF